jgi:large subunit ribosomal protein L21
MYAVVNTGGKQYKVQQGEVLRVEKIPGDVGSPVTFDRVLMFSDGENVNIGQPVLDNVAVEGHIVEQGKAKKIIVFKYKKRKRYRRTQGHRQTFTAVQIDSIAPMAAKTEETPQKVDDVKPEAETVEAEKAAPETAAAEAKTEETPQKADDVKPEAETVEAEKAAPETAAAEAKTEETPQKADDVKPEAEKVEAEKAAPETAAAEETSAETPKAKKPATKKAVPKETDEE